MNYNNLSIEELHKFKKKVETTLHKIYENSELSIVLFGVDFVIKDERCSITILKKVLNRIDLDLDAHHKSLVS
jgi:hypothetical protein